VDGPEEQYLEPTRVGVEEEWQMLSAGMMNTCGIDREAQLRCWGELNGVTTPLPQVVLGDQAIARVTTDTFHRCAVNTSGELYCWGRGIEGQLGTGDFMRHDIPVAIVTPLPVEDVSVGRFQTCILLQDHTVWCAGANEDGQIGLGDMERRSEFTRLEFAQ
jgi:alpha-tubulin suppressor-like RCC1 family protein